MNRGIADLQSAALPFGYGAIRFLRVPPQEIGAGNEARTRYLHLGKVALYRMSYARIPLKGVVPPVGVEPTTRGFSVRCSTY